MKLNIKAFAFTLGIVWGLLVFLYTWWVIVQGVYLNMELPTQKVFLEYIYPFYSITPAGSLIGLIYGVIDGLIVGAGIAWLYNLISGKSVKQVTA
jgi:hypothetical protein